MAIPHAQPGDVIDVRPLGDSLNESKTKALIKTPHFEVIRMVLPSGKVIAEHQAPGEIMVQCLEGRINFTTMGKTTELQAGSMLFLQRGEPHALQALEASSFLLTILMPGNEAHT